MQFSLDQLHWQGENKKNLVLPGMWDLLVGDLLSVKMLWLDGRLGRYLTLLSSASLKGHCPERFAVFRSKLQSVESRFLQPSWNNSNRQSFPLVLVHCNVIPNISNARFLDPLCMFKSLLT